MFKLKVVLILFLIFSFSGMILSKSFAESNTSNTLLNLLTRSNVHPKTISLTYGESIGSYDHEDLLALKQRLKDEFSIKLPAPKKPCCVQVAYQYIGQKKVSGNSLEIKLESMKPTLGGSKLQTYLLVTYNLGTPSKQNATQSFGYLRSHLLKMGFSPKINTTIQGSLSQKLNHNEQLHYLTTLFKQVNGKITEGLNEKDVVSFTGYTNEFSRSTTSNGRSINLEIASRYDPLSQTTIITIGNPIITENY